MFDFLARKFVWCTDSAVFARTLTQLSAFSFQLSAKPKSRRIFLAPGSWHLAAGSRGFTLIEMISIVAIISVITGLFMVSNSAFGGKVLLENLAYDIALSIRESQVFGISVQRFGTTNFTAGYGMHFDISSPADYSTFADALTENGLYDCPTPGSTATCELVQTTSISRGFRISTWRCWIFFSRDLNLMRG
jgi:hypothetical protein